MKFIGFKIVVYNSTTYEIVAVFKEWSAKVSDFIDSSAIYDSVNPNSGGKRDMSELKKINQVNNTDF